MTGPSGQPTNVAFGLIRDMLNLLRTRKPDFVAAAFDGGGPLTRNEIFADYKATRGPMPDDLRPQIAVARRVFEAFRVPVLIHEGAEADDVIATLAGRRAPERGLDVTIITSDKDARQLLTDNIRILNLRDNKFIDAAALLADWGITPAQVVDYLSLTGDSVDNVPGVPGIGPKTATELLQKFGDLETLLASIDKVSGAKRQQNLREHSETAGEARTLVELHEKISRSPLDWEDSAPTATTPRQLKAICIECGFHAFLNEIVDTAPRPGSRLGHESLQDDRHARKPRGVRRRSWRAQPKFSVDTETTSRRSAPARRSSAIPSRGPRARPYYLPVRGPMFDKRARPGRRPSRPSALP